MVGLLILVTAGVGVVNPLLIRVVFDSALFPNSGSPDLTLLWVLAGVMAGITVVGGLLGILQTYLTNQIGQNVMRDLRDRLYRHLQRQPLSFFTDTRTGEIQSRVSNDVGGVQTVVTNTVSNTIANSVIFLSTLAAMFVLSWQLTLVAVGTVPVFAFLTGYVGRRRRKVTAQAQESMAEMSAITQETLSVSGITLSKLFGRQDREIQRFNQENREALRPDSASADDWPVFLGGDADILLGFSRGYLSAGWLPDFGKGSGRDYRRDHRGLYNSAEPPLFPHWQPAASVRRAPIFLGLFRENFRVSGHSAEDFRLAKGR